MQVFFRKKPKKFLSQKIPVRSTFQRLDQFLKQKNSAKNKKDTILEKYTYKQYVSRVTFNKKICKHNINVTRVTYTYDKKAHTRYTCNIHDR